jgi:hypothetical protein
MLTQQQQQQQQQHSHCSRQRVLCVCVCREWLCASHWTNFTVAGHMGCCLESAYIHVRICALGWVCERMPPPPSRQRAAAAAAAAAYRRVSKALLQSLCARHGTEPDGLNLTAMALGLTVLEVRV